MEYYTSGGVNVFRLSTSNQMLGALKDAVLRMKAVGFMLVALTLLLVSYAHWPITPLPEGTKADLIVVQKAERKLALLNQGQLLKEYKIALGGTPTGPKRQEGDAKTPEGLYKIDYRKPDSSYHLALHISYPSNQDSSDAARRGVSAGGAVMVHGIRNGLGIVGRLHRVVDWTNGCIAVTNPEIEEIARVVSDGTPIEIRP